MFRVLSLALVACLLMAGSAFADMKIGVFNSQAVAMDSDAAKAAQQKLQSQFGAEKTQLEKQAKDLQSKGEALQAQVAKMSAKEREDKQMEFLRLRRAFEDMRDLVRHIHDFYKRTRISRRLVDLFHGSQTSYIITQAALRNKVSIGCHHRVD